MFQSCIQKQNQVIDLFSCCKDEEQKYKKIIEFGKKLLLLPDIYKSAENIVKGCQSTVYLRSALNNGVVEFQASSDALISAGLAAILIEVYSGETPETILKCPPDYLEKLGLSASLTPNRANGLYSIHLRMKQDALKLYMAQQVLGR